MRLILLGTAGGPTPKKNRAAPAQMILVNDEAYIIDCGNGTVNLTSTAVCRYVAGGTFAPRCTINGNITSPACTKTVTVTPPPVAPACRTVITGTQTFPLTSVTPGLCNVGNLTPLSFTASVV